MLTALLSMVGRDPGDLAEADPAGEAACCGNSSTGSRANVLTGRGGSQPGVMRVEHLVGGPDGALDFGAMLAD